MTKKEEVQTQVSQMIDLVSDLDSSDIRFDLISQMIDTCLKMAKEGHDSGQVKLVTHALKEMRYAYHVFNQYKGIRKVSIYGSARTDEKHPDYIAAAEFGRLIAETKWMAITGAGDGIMKAGHEGPTRESSFGLAIRLPFETTANTIIEGDSKLINFRYFFTRKLMFMTHSDAIVGCPGGFGTQDEMFEALTLVQTGKSNIVPIVMIAGEGNNYWLNWQKHVQEDLLGNDMISPEDESLFHIADSPQDGVDHILQFYKNFHSSRYVRSDLVIRIQNKITEESIAHLNDSYQDVLSNGEIKQSGALSSENDYLELPRIIVPHTRKSNGRIRQLIDQINLCDLQS